MRVGQEGDDAVARPVPIPNRWWCRGQIAVALATFLACSVAGIATACEAGICVERIVPDDGEEIPRNALLWVSYDNVNGFDIEAILRDDAGVEVPIVTETFELGPLETLAQRLLLVEPMQELESGGSYTLTVTPEEDLCAGSVDVVKTFTAGEDVDHVAPTFDGIASLDAAYIPDYSAGSNCTLGPPRFRYQVEGAPADGAVGGAVAYRLYLDGELVALAPVGPRTEGGGVPRPTNVVTYDEPTDEGGEPPNRCFVLRAVDLAGNEDANEDVVCLDGAVDGGEADDDDYVGGCACALTRPDGGDAGAGFLAVVAIGLLGAAVGRRRRFTSCPSRGRVAW